jgi:hypothetical protein
MARRHRCCLAGAGPSVRSCTPESQAKPFCLSGVNAVGCLQGTMDVPDEYTGQ